MPTRRRRHKLLTVSRLHGCWSRLSIAVWARTRPRSRHRFASEIWRSLATSSLSAPLRSRQKVTPGTCAARASASPPLIYAALSANGSGGKHGAAASNARIGAASTAPDSRHPGKPISLRRLLRMWPSSDLPSHDRQIEPCQRHVANSWGRRCGPRCLDKPLMVTPVVTNGKLHGVEPLALSDEEPSLAIPPHSTQAEEAVLGSVLKRGLAIADVAPFLKPQHFYEIRNRHVYAAMAALFERAAAIDYHTLAEELTRQGTYDLAGGLLYVSELNLSTPSAAHIEHYARIALEHAVRRRYISAAQQVAELAWNQRRDLDTIKQRSEALVLGAHSDTLGRRAVLPPSEWTEHLMDYLGQARAGGLAGVSTGLRDLDTMTLGMSPGLYLLAAATGTGKTAIAGQIALHVAEHHGPVVLVSMELTDVDLAVRLVSVITNIRKEKLVTGTLTDGQAAEVLVVIQRLARSRVHIVFGSGYTSSDVRQLAEIVRPGEGAIMPSQQPFECLFGCLLRVEGGYARQRWLPQEALGNQQVLARQR
jgi:DnaB-like helicase N terminal domain/DnaB-like helicase C terminal domain